MKIYENDLRIWFSFLHIQHVKLEAHNKPQLKPNHLIPSFFIHIRPLHTGLRNVWDQDHTSYIKTFPLSIKASGRTAYILTYWDYMQATALCKLSGNTVMPEAS